MIQERLRNYKKYLELKGYQKSSIQGLLRTADNYQKQHPQNKKLKKSTRQLYYYQKKIYIKYLEEIESEKHYLQEEHYKKELPKIEILTIEEIKDLTKKSKDLREQAVLACLYNLGLRLSEAAGIDIEDINIEKQLLLIKQSKTKKQRQVPINKNTLQTLINYIQQERTNKGSKLLQGIKGNLTPGGIYQIIKKIVKRTKTQKRIYPHLLRHSIASHLLQAGMPVEQIGKFLGHSSLESTQRYTHL